MFDFGSRYTVSWLAMILVSITLNAQVQTVGLFLNVSLSYQGYTLFAPAAYRNTYLIDNAGLLVHSWESNHTPGLSAYLLENGNLLRTATFPIYTFSGGGLGGVIQEFEWDGTLVWEFKYSSFKHHQHHDVESLPNGNILIIAWEYKDYWEVLGAGRDHVLLSQDHLWPDHIVEVQPDSGYGGKIVWEWHVWDHLIQDYHPGASNYGEVSLHPELININYVGPGAIAYNEKLDQIILSVLKFSEIWVIDHSTTTEEAAGHTGGKYGKGGDLLYRWGNPQTYDRGEPTDQMLFAQHDAHWIEPGLPGEGNILIFNNGRKRPGGDASSIDEIAPPVDQYGNYLLDSNSSYLPNTLCWSYTAPNPTGFYAANLSGAQRQPNGNTLTCDGPSGKFFEVNIDGDIVWSYINPVIKSGPMTQGGRIPGQENRVFKIARYGPDYPGFSGKDLTAGNQIEIYPLSIEKNNIEFYSVNDRLINIYPNPTNDVLNIETLQPGIHLTEISSLNGQLIYSRVMEGANQQIDLSSFQKGVYFITIRSKDFVTTEKVIKQ